MGGLVDGLGGCRPYAAVYSVATASTALWNVRMSSR
eukprot:COSAG05_NODE_18859_length_301_cov_1.148515_1_plen_35_part_10